VDRAQDVGLFRWRVVSEATDVSLCARERGALVRSLAARELPGAIAEYTGPAGPTGCTTGQRPSGSACSRA